MIRTNSQKDYVPLILGSILMVLLSNGMAAQQKAITAGEVIARIQKTVGVPWRSETVDTFKAGDPNTQVTGIAVTMMATMDVLQRAVASGKNLIITHEPTFYDHLDTTRELEAQNDGVLAAKQRFIKEHGLVIWRFHDHWHMRQPDGILAGMVHALQWEKFQDQENPGLFLMPETTLGGLAAAIKNQLGIHVVRVVGDPAMKLTKVALRPGASGFEAEVRFLENDKVEALVIGETREWETVEYVADAVTLGRKKSLIILGHIPSEQAGMEECTRWLKTFVPEVPIEFISTPEPFSAAR